MVKQKGFIPNPNRISKIEQEFISTQNFKVEEVTENDVKENYKGRMISMSDSFFHKLNNYLKKNPTEGNRSGFIVRVVADYIDNKNR